MSLGSSNEDISYGTSGKSIENFSAGTSALNLSIDLSLDDLSLDGISEAGSIKSVDSEDENKLVFINLADSNCNNGKDDNGKPCMDTNTLMNLL